MDWSVFAKPEVIWFIIGLVLALLEFLIPGLIVLFFGVGAWVTALCYLLFAPGLNGQIFIFIFSSLLSLFLLRKALKKMFFKENPYKEDTLEDEFIGRTALVEETIQADKPGKVIFKGTQWSATADTTLKKGRRVTIIGKESITLRVQAY